MSELDAFRDAIRRIRAGDEQAAADLVRQYEPLIRREVRLQLQDRRLARAFDSMDICQSVMASFFVRAAAGQYDLGKPEDLAGLLVTMARRKVASAARRQYRQRRDARRTAGGSHPGFDAVPDDEPTPSQQVSHRELMQRMHRHLSEEELKLAELRRAGLSWAEIAAHVGGTAQARRVQLDRAIERVLDRLGLAEAPDA